MKKTIKNASLLLLLLTTVCFTACRKDKTPENTDPIINDMITPGRLTLKFENLVGTDPLVLDTKWYINQNADSFIVSKLRYYISNIQLIKTDGTVFSEVESYHLIDQEKSASGQFTINNVPYGDYKGIRFLIGVDSARNISGAQTGALDVTNDMFWTWKTGYIMAKLEGERPKLKGATRLLQFHIGGFTGQYNSLRTVEFKFGSTATVSKTTQPALIFTADVLEWFKTPNIVNFDVFSSAMMPGQKSKEMADNYSDMFTLKSIGVIQP